MFRLVAASLALLQVALPAIAPQDPMPDRPDPFPWLEDVESERALDWVRARNAQSTAELCADDLFAELQQRTLAILDSTARIPYVNKRGAFYYNLWQDADNPRGLWRRTGLQEYEKDDADWDIVLDLDALGRTEGENWVWKGVTFLRPERRRCLISLSRGGADAVAVREFDLQSRAFVEDGFALPEAKTMVSWRDQDSIFVSTDFGAGSMTTSGYPRTARLWYRGTPLASAETVAEGKPEDVFLSATHDQTPGFPRDLVFRGITFYQNELFLLQDGKPVKIEKPDSANATVFREWLLIELRQDWQPDAVTYPAGALLATKLDGFLAGAHEFDVLFGPSDRTSLEGFSPTQNHLLINILDNVKNRIEVLTHTADGWQREQLPGLPRFGTVSVSALDAEDCDDYFLTIADYVTPTSLWLGTIGKGPARQLKSLPSFFSAEGLEVQQCETLSPDGTRVPYFLVARKNIERNGKNPTLLYGYGGFEISMTPGYGAATGASWLERGGVFAVANIRGGGEFGPRWHQAALKQNRHRCYEDFAAVAKDLIRKKITSPPHLGTQGGSNGGLLVGNMLTTYPELFGAIVCQVPLLDMMRYHKLLAGASWMGEYGNPDDPEVREWLVNYSPYHCLRADGEYPRVLFTTSTRDDRVHPGHARKMMALMMQHGHDALYYENIEGGHGGAADNKQAAFMSALAYAFLWRELR